MDKRRRYEYPARPAQCDSAPERQGDGDRRADDIPFYFVDTTELYYPATNTWTLTGYLNTARADGTTTLLRNGDVLIAGGREWTGGVSSAELDNPGLGFQRPDWQPLIYENDPLQFIGRSLSLVGVRFQGISPASGGRTIDSATNHPVVQLRSLDNSEVRYLSADAYNGWSDKSLAQSRCATSRLVPR